MLRSLIIFHLLSLILTFLLLLIPSSSSSSPGVVSALNSSYCKQEDLTVGVLGYVCDCADAPDETIVITGSHPELSSPEYSLRISLSGENCTVAIFDLEQTISELKLVPPAVREKSGVTKDQAIKNGNKVAANITISNVKCNMTRASRSGTSSCILFSATTYSETMIQRTEPLIPMKVDHLSISNIVVTQSEPNGFSHFPYAQTGVFEAVSFFGALMDFHFFQIQNVSLHFALAADKNLTSALLPLVGTQPLLLSDGQLNITGVRFLQEIQFSRINYSLSDIHVNFYRSGNSNKELKQNMHGDDSYYRGLKRVFIRGVSFEGPVKGATAMAAILGSPNGIGFNFDGIHVTSSDFWFTNESYSSSSSSMTSPFHVFAGVHIQNNFSLNYQPEYELSSPFHRHLFFNDVTVDLNNISIISSAKEAVMFRHVDRTNMIASAVLIEELVSNIANLRFFNLRASIQSMLPIAVFACSCATFSKNPEGIGLDATTPIVFSSSKTMMNLQGEGASIGDDDLVRYNTNSSNLYVLHFDDNFGHIREIEFHSPFHFLNNSLSASTSQAVRREFYSAMLDIDSVFSMSDALTSTTSSVIRIEDNLLSLQNMKSLQFRTYLMIASNSIISTHSFFYLNNKLEFVNVLYAGAAMRLSAWEAFQNANSIQSEINGLMLNAHSDVGSGMFQGLQIVQYTICHNSFYIRNFNISTESIVRLKAYYLGATLGRGFATTAPQSSTQNFKFLASNNSFDASDLSLPQQLDNRLTVFDIVGGALHVDSILLENNTMVLKGHSQGAAINDFAYFGTSIDDVSDVISVSGNRISITIISHPSSFWSQAVIGFGKDVTMKKVTEDDRDNNKVFLLIQRNDVHINMTSRAGSQITMIRFSGVVATPNLFITNNIFSLLSTSTYSSSVTNPQSSMTSYFLQLTAPNITKLLRVSQNKISFDLQPDDQFSNSKCLSMLWFQFGSEDSIYFHYFKYRGDVEFDNLDVRISSRCTANNEIRFFRLGAFKERDESLEKWVSTFTFSNIRAKISSLGGDIDSSFLTLSGANTALKQDLFYVLHNSIEIETSGSLLTSAISMTMGLFIEPENSRSPVWIRKVLAKNFSIFSSSSSSGEMSVLRSDVTPVQFFFHRHRKGVQFLIGSFTYQDIFVNLGRMTTMNLNTGHKCVMFTLAGGDTSNSNAAADLLPEIQLQFDIENIQFHVESYQAAGPSLMGIASIGRLFPANLPEKDSFFEFVISGEKYPKFRFSVKNTSLKIVKNGDHGGSFFSLIASDGVGVVYEAVGNSISLNLPSAGVDTEPSFAGPNLVIQASVFHSIEGFYLTRRVTVSNNAIVDLISGAAPVDAAIVRMGGGTAANASSIFRLPWVINGNRLEKISLLESPSSDSSIASSSSNISILTIQSSKEDGKMMRIKRENRASNKEILLSGNIFNVSSSSSSNGDICTHSKNFDSGCSIIHFSEPLANFSIEEWKIEKSQVIIASSPNSHFSFVKAFDSDFVESTNSWIFAENSVHSFSPTAASSRMKLWHAFPDSNQDQFLRLGAPRNFTFLCNLDWDHVVFEKYFLGNYSFILTTLYEGEVNVYDRDSPICKSTRTRSLSRELEPERDLTNTSEHSTTASSHQLSPSDDPDNSSTFSKSATNHIVIDPSKSSSHSLSSTEPSTSPTQEQTPSTSHPLTKTQTYRKQPLPPPLTTEPFPGASTVLAASSIFSGNPAAYQLTQKMMMGAKLLNCGNGILEEKLQDSTSDTLKGDVDAVEELSVESNPLGMKIGSLPLDSHRGSFVGNILVCVIFAALLSIVTYVFGSIRKLSKFVDAEKKIHHPGFNAVSLGVMSAATSFSIGIVAGSFGTDLSDGAAKDMTLLAVGTLFMVVFPVFIFARVFQRCRARERIRVVEDTDYFMIFDEELEQLDEDEEEKEDDEEENDEEEPTTSGSSESKKKKKNPVTEEDKGNTKNKNKNKNKKKHESKHELAEYFDDEELQTKNHFKNLTTNLKKQKDRERALEARRINNIVSSKLKRSPCSPKVLIFRMLRYWIVPWKEWRTTTWVKRFAPFIDALELPFYGMLELGVPILIGLASGYSTFCESAACCQGLSIFSLVVSAIHLFFFLFLKPFMNRLDVTFGGFGCIATLVQSIFVTAGVFGVDWMTEVVEVASQVAGSFGLLVILFTFLSYMPRMRKIVRVLCKGMVDKDKKKKKKQNNDEKKQNKKEKQKQGKERKNKEMNKKKQTLKSLAKQDHSSNVKEGNAASSSPTQRNAAAPTTNLIDLHQQLLAEPSTADFTNSNNNDKQDPMLTLTLREDDLENQQQQEEDEKKLVEESTITMKDEHGHEFSLQLEDVDYEEYFSDQDDEDEEEEAEEDNYEDEEEMDNYDDYEGSEYHIDDFKEESEEVEVKDQNNDVNDDGDEDLTQHCQEYSFDEIRKFLNDNDDEK